MTKLTRSEAQIIHKKVTSLLSEIRGYDDIDIVDKEYPGLIEQLTERFKELKEKQNNDT